MQKARHKLVDQLLIMELLLRKLEKWNRQFKKDIPEAYKEMKELLENYEFSAINAFCLMFDQEVRDDKKNNR